MASPLSTTVAAASNGQALPTANIYVASVAGFSAAGVLFVQDSRAGVQIVRYTGTSTAGGAHFTGCTGGTGYLATNGEVLQAISTTITAASNGQTLPQGTINVASTTAFPGGGPFIYVQTSAGYQVVSTTAVGATTFTGCAGGTGTMSTGGEVVLPAWTMVAIGSNGLQLPQAVLNVFTSTQGFPASGMLAVQTSAGRQVVTYTGVTASSFTGCAGGSGYLSTYDAVWALGAPSTEGATIVTVASLAELRLLYPASSGIQKAEVLGANVPGDGGGGIFTWDWETPAGTFLDDNQGIVIHSAWPAAAAGRWWREGFQQTPNASGITTDQAPQELSVKWFGALGDGATDDTLAIQAAINACVELFSGINNTRPALAGAADFSITPTVLFPTGNYLVSATLNALYSIGLRGEGWPMIQTTNATIPILRIGAALQNIEGITFVGGMHAIAMFGSVNGGYLSPTADGNVPCYVRHCNFIYQAGPSIWQDTGPHAIVQSTLALPLTGATVTVNSTAGFQVSGNVSFGTQGVFIDTAGIGHQFNYTGSTGTTFTGVTTIDGLTATVAAGSVISLPGLCRTFQTILKVEDFYFYGASLFWGSGDSVYFTNGHIAWDFSHSPLSGDGLPLGVWNSCDTLYLDNITGFGGAPLARSAMIVAQYYVGATNCAFAQSDEFPFIRSRGTANTYQGAGSAPVPLNMWGGGGPLVFAGSGLGLVCSFGAFWIEAYEFCPAQVSLKNYETNDFQNTLGIWLDQASISLSSFSSNQLSLQFIDIDPPILNPASIYYGWDSGPTTQLSYLKAIDITDHFKQAITRYQSAILGPPQLNTFGFPNGNTAFGLFNSTGVFNDTSTGYTVQMSKGALTNSYGYFEFTNTQVFPNSVTAGIYTLSYYFKANFPGLWLLTSMPTNNGATKFYRYGASNQFQRLETTFYYAGNSAPFVFGGSTYDIPSCVVAWAVSTAYAATARVTAGGNQYLCVTAGTSAAAGGGPAGTGANIADGTVVWNYAGPGGVFTPAIGCGLFMLNEGEKAEPYVYGGNADAHFAFGTVPGVYYGTAAPTTGTYVVGDVVQNTAPAASGFMGWVCVTAGTPGTWKSFGPISP